jgi:hypothetical protein
MDRDQPGDGPTGIIQYRAHLHPVRHARMLDTVIASQRMHDPAIFRAAVNDRI